MADVVHRFDPDALIACQSCDLLHRRREVPCGANARCRRCGTVLIKPRRGAIAMIVSFAAAALVLMLTTIAAPFLAIATSGLTSSASVIDAVTSFALASGLMAPLSVLVAVLIIILPLVRLFALIYALLPILLERPLPPYAAAIFRVAITTRQWAMAEIFMIGVAVALVKIQSLASVSFGPAFFAFAAFVLVIAAKEAVLCERSIWPLLTKQ